MAANLSEVMFFCPFYGKISVWYGRAYLGG